MHFLNYNIEGLIIIIYLSFIITINFVSFVLMGLDKYKAIKGSYRISEISFLTLGFMGGAVGVLLGMVCFRHKTNKKKFYIGIPILFVINQIVHLLIYYIGTKLN